MVKRLSFFFCFTFLSAQAEMNFSYEMKYGDGQQVTGTASGNPDTTAYSYFENLMDVNLYLGSNLYLFTQLEYSDNPVYGSRRTTLDSVINTFYLEYSGDNYLLKLGDLYELYGRGLSFYTHQDQNIDYNNSVRGAYLHYWLRDNIEISTLYGYGDYLYRSNPSFRKTNRKISSAVFAGSVRYEHDLLGFINYSYTNQNIDLDPKLTKVFEDDNEIRDDLVDRMTNDPNFPIEVLDEEILDTVQVHNNNVNWNASVGPLEFYIDKSWITYDKIYGDPTFGSRFYSSIYTELFETGITYEYKSYFTPYLIKSISNPPIVYRESNSVLASRNAHSINFGNEIGHQIEFNRVILGDKNLSGNLSMSFRHQDEEMLGMSFFDFLKMDENEQLYNYFPYRQGYLELNGWTLNDKLYFKIGLDQFTEFNVGSKHIFATTIPTQWTWKFHNGNSFTTYVEAQSKTVKGPIPEDYLGTYLSTSYSHQGKWILTGFYDQETSEDKTNTWPGVDFSYNINSETQVSLFYGSQKGGLVCANGICAEQPGFENGMKITLRSLF